MTDFEFNKVDHFRQIKKEITRLQPGGISKQHQAG